MIREIVLDTETTGIDPANGDRIVEIGCVELFNHIPTGKTFHVYINPERSMPYEAFKVHGLSDEFLADKPVFSVIAAEFAEFIGEDRLIIHNAGFDIGFINAEFARLNRESLSMNRVVDTLALARRKHPPVPVPDLLGVADTLALARRKHPGAQNNLDALANRYGVDNSKRTKHGALLDSEILAEVYIELIGGKQADFGLATRVGSGRAGGMNHKASERRIREDDGTVRITDAEREAHSAFIAKMGDKALWRTYIDEK